MSDVDDEALPQHYGGEIERWEGPSEVLTPLFNVDKIVERIKKDAPVRDVSHQ